MNPSQLRQLRIVHAILLVAALVYLMLGEKLRHGAQPRPLNGSFVAAIIGMAIILIAIIFFLKTRFIRRSEETLRLNTTSTAALVRWRMGYITGFALSEAVVLYGFVLRLLGATLSQALPLYTAGIVLLLVLRPRDPLPPA